MFKQLSLFVLIIIPLVLFAACTPAATPTPVATATRAATSTTLATVTPIPTSTSTPTAAPTATATQILLAQPTIISGLAIPNAKIIYYDIVGSTESELRAQMEALGPIDPTDNKKAASSKLWSIRWNWTGYGTNTCDLNTAQVSYEVTVTLPRWKLSADASRDLITKWNRYVSALVFHEKGHVDNIVNNYQTVLTAIKGATCQTAESAAQAALQALRKFDLDYDYRTDKGALQGAIFR